MDTEDAAKPLITSTEYNRAAELGRNEYWWEHHLTLEVSLTSDSVPWEFTAPTWFLVLWIIIVVCVLWWRYDAQR